MLTYSQIASAARQHAAPPPVPSILSTRLLSPDYRPSDVDAFIRAMEGKTVAARARIAARSPRRPDVPERLHRRRRLAASGPMPPDLAEPFTTGQIAALKIVADEYRERGSCRLSYREIGDRSGVSRETVKDAVQLAARLNLLAREERRSPGRRSDPNVITIVSAAWRDWLAKRPLRRVAGGVGVRNYPPQTEGRTRRAVGMAHVPPHGRGPPQIDLDGRRSA